MARKKNLYRATYFRDGERVTEMVDLFALPYEYISADHPMCILGDVSMGRDKSRSWPDFTHVSIGGTFDCSSFQITPDTVLPTYFECLVCSNSQTDFSVFLDCLPGEFLALDNPTIFIGTALMHKIRKDIGGALDIARQFAAMYPNVVVTDNKYSLQDVIARANQPQTVAAAPVVEKPQPIKPVENAPAPRRTIGCRVMNYWNIVVRNPIFSRHCHLTRFRV